MDYRKRTNEELCALIQQGDELAVEALLKNNVPLVQQISNDVRTEFKVRKEFSGYELVSNEDLLQVGDIALWTSAMKFDASRGNLFSTYAYKHVRGSMIDQIKRNLEAESRMNRDYDILWATYTEAGFDAPSESELRKIEHGEILTSEEEKVYSMAEGKGAFAGYGRLTRKDIAKMTGLTLAQVNRRYYSARKKLQESFGFYDLWEGIPEDILKQLIEKRNEKRARDAEKFKWKD